MAFDSFSDLMMMSGHGYYVWSAYGICFVVLMSLVLTPIIKTRIFLKQQALIQNRETITGEALARPQHTIS